VVAASLSYYDELSTDPFGPNPTIWI